MNEVPPSSSSPCCRMHIVLVPGFAGFDALGQLEYYSGVTPCFHAWRDRGLRAERDNVALHYFDNFPTAAVVTRAARLRAYLAKRIARGEFAPADRIVLVGHSTGGLDIRQLVWDLGQNRTQVWHVDGDVRSSVSVSAEEILHMICGAVFLSVPHFGTDIAEWVRTYWLGRKSFIEYLRLVVAGSQWPAVGLTERLATGVAGMLSGADLLYTVQDCLAEADAGFWPVDPVRTADAHEAAAQLALWLRHAAWDFAVIDDLTPVATASRVASPAQFSCEVRERERQTWAQFRIAAKSYATIGPRVFAFTPAQAAPRWDLAKPCTYPDVTETTEAARGTDFVYRTCYRACAGWPPSDLMPVPPPSTLTTRQQAVIAAWNIGQIEVWDNDGIANTVSMLRPPAGDVVLVPGDHMDIVGHFEAVRASAGSGRTYHSYDLLNSQSGFSMQTFNEVWNDVFEFALIQAAARCQPHSEQGREMALPAEV